MDIIKKKIIDHEMPLTNEQQEGFCLEYVRLDIEEQITNKRARRIKAYRFIYPETLKDSDHVCNTRATRLLAKKPVAERIRALYEEEGSSVENEFSWTRSKSEGLLVDIAYDEEQKTADRIKAIGELNKMKGIEVPKVEVEETAGDSIDKFFGKFKGIIDG